MDGYRRSISKPDALLEWPQRAGARARQLSGRSPLSVDESCRVLADLQRPDRGHRKAAVAGMAGVWLVYLVACFGPAVRQRIERRRLTGQHDFRGAVPYVRAGS